MDSYRECSYGPKRIRTSDEIGISGVDNCNLVITDIIYFVPYPLVEDINPFKGMLFLHFCIFDVDGD